MTRFQRILATLFSGLLITAAASVTPTAAQAASPTPKPILIQSAALHAAAYCPDGYLCFWPHPNYGGHYGQTRESNRDWRSWPDSECWSGTWNDCASSVVNNTDCAVDLYRDIRWSGGYYTIEPRGSIDDLRLIGMDDQISSDVFEC